MELFTEDAGQKSEIDESLGKKSFKLAPHLPLIAREEAALRRVRPLTDHSAAERWKSQESARSLPDSPQSESPVVLQPQSKRMKAQKQLKR